MKYLVTILCTLMIYPVFGQHQKKKALFLGNSYTYVNNLPQMVRDAALSTGDTLIFDSSAPGGYTFQNHFNDVGSRAKIVAGNWDYVVLQEQSQLPSFPNNSVNRNVFQYARKLDSLINVHNPCSETVFYMTWGRKNGDAQNCSFWPPVCTYAGMDSLLSLRYRMMADNNDAILSPVGAVWKYIRQHHPLIELYDPDQSHPSVAGTYAAACSFYTAFFRKNPAAISFNATLTATEAATIRAAAKLVVYDSLLNWHIGEYDPKANFSYLTSGQNLVTFTNSSANATSHYWNFGDGNTSTLASPVHAYATPGQYTVTLIAGKCGLQDTFTQSITLATTGIPSWIEPTEALQVYPNPATTILSLSLEPNRNLEYKIHNLLGGKELTGELKNAENRIGIERLPEGIYLLRLYENGIIISRQKFIKLKN